jgi:hypothetical protein
LVGFFEHVGSEGVHVSLLGGSRFKFTGGIRSRENRG